MAVIGASANLGPVIDFSDAIREAVAEATALVARFLAREVVEPLRSPR